MRKAGMNMERVRQQNRSLILKHINDKGPSSRKAIAAATGLTQASVTQITTVLIAEGILRETGITVRKAGFPGRREVLLDIDAGRFLTFAVNAEPDKTTVVVCDFMGNIVTGLTTGPLKRKLETDGSIRPEEFLERICLCCEEMKSDLPEQTAEKIECVAFAVTGFVDRERGISRRAFGIWDREVDIKSFVEDRLKLPLILENNVNAFAGAELMFGSGRIHDDLLVIKWGPGVGSSVIIDGGVYHGRNGRTAELGHFITDPAGEKCLCGRTGCLETLVSAKALKKAEEEGRLKEVIDCFARCIVNAGTILAPNRIVLYGRISDNKYLREELIRACAAYDPVYDEKYIIHTSLSNRRSYIGPAALFTMRKILF